MSNNIPTLNVYARVWSNTGHLQQLFAGFSILHSADRINYRQIISKPPTRRCEDMPLHLRDAHMAHCSISVNNSIRIYYDMHDSWEIDKSALESHDFYFKRSYHPARVMAFGHAASKIHPYGLNYEVVRDPVDFFGLQRTLLSRNGRQVLSTFGWATGLGRFWQFVPRLASMESPPSGEVPHRVLFMARTWGADETSEAVLDEERRLDRIRINEDRASCIRVLRKSFGDRFIGGFSPTPHAIKHYPDLVVGDKSYTKKNYLALVKNSGICIATTGLHQSIGWKFGEYVALSKCIVSEPLSYTVPGNFSAGRNYLVFCSADDCVEKVDRLLTDSELRSAMAHENWLYYQQRLRPDALVWRTLEQAIG